MDFGLALDFWSTAKSLERLLDDHVRLVKTAEKLGFHSVWAGENRAQAPEPGHVPAPFLVLAAIARETKLRLGTGVTLLAGWHPAKLVYDAALLDQLSGGRFTLGIGLGNPGLMKQHGMPEDKVGPRLDETLRFLKEMWSGAGAFDGRYIRMKGRVYPPPVEPGGPPLWVGGKVQRSAERAAELGDAWYGATQYHFEVVRRQARFYREALARRGKDPASGTVAINRTTFLAPSVDAARAEGKPYVSQVLHAYARYGLIEDEQGRPRPDDESLYDAVGDEAVFVGTPESCAESIRKYREAGVTQINLRVAPGNMPFELAERTVRLFGERVLPVFRNSTS